MPTYEYRCDYCGYNFEEFQKISDDPVSYCPRCNGKVRRLMSTGVGLIFKGSGFYITDYARKDNKNNKEKSPAVKIPKEKEKSGEKEATHTDD
jgi:putative FmdB family regulatory protein